MPIECLPSQQQLQAFAQRPEHLPAVLVYQWDAGPEGEDLATTLARRAPAFAGTLRWAASEEQVLIGPVPRYQRACCVHFPRRRDARLFIESPGHIVAVQGLKSLRVTLTSEQPRAIRLLSNLLARVLPQLPMDRRTEPGEEPFLGSSTMPTPEALKEFRAHPEPEAPVVMINWLKFKPMTVVDGTSLRGAVAYRRYGKVALRVTHAIGAKLLFAARYQQVLLGNDGDPALGRWDECALMQYPGRKGFDHMSSLAIYRRALADRHAGLAEHGQALTISRPDAGYIWHR